MNDTFYPVLKSLPVHLHEEMFSPTSAETWSPLPLRELARGLELKIFTSTTLASYLTMGGGNIRALQTLIGHKDLRMTMRYSHLSAEYLREAVSILDKGLGRSVSNQEIQIGNTGSSQL